jgi:NADPH2:quinone reductase
VRAVTIHEFGGPEVLVAGDVPDPVPGPGQVVVDVAFANITFVETQVRAGRGPFTVELPHVPGNGVGGVVAGRRVVTSTGGSGGYAERAAVDAAGLVDVPENVALDAAVALLADGRTATMLVDAAQVRAGDRVLIEAAAGGVGTLLVQLARAAGARVVAAAGGERKLTLARELGAEIAVDYRDPGWPEAVRARAGSVDVVLDGVGGAVSRAALGLLGPGGRMLSFGLASGHWSDVTDADAQARGARLVRLERPSPQQARAFTRRALAAAAAGRLRPVIGRRFALEDAAAAHAAIEARATIGKTLLDVRRPPGTR